MKYQLFFSGLLLAIMMMTSTFTTAQVCVESTAETRAMHQEKIRLTNDDNDILSLTVLVADDPYERAGGFQHICPEVIENTLILFRFRQEIRSKFHMSYVHAPLDIAFFDSRGYVVGVRLMEIYTAEYQPLYGPEESFQYALEAPAGFFKQHKISSQGSQLILQ